MKKYLLITCMAALTCTYAMAGQNTGNGKKQQSGSAGFSNDIIIEGSSVDQAPVKLATAFNGWQYAAYSTFDFNTFDGGVTIRMSKDGGLTWTTVDSYNANLVTYNALDITVAGTDTNNLTLFNAVIAEDINNSSFTLYVDAYNARTGAYNGSNFSVNNIEGPINDVAITTDYAYPATGASPYSVGLLYSTSSATNDSILFTGSTDGGATWDVNEVVMVTDKYFRKVSIAYGKSASASNGRYFGAWEMLTSLGNPTGNIFTSRSASSVDGAWIAPVEVDSILPEHYGFLSNPTIAVQYGAVNNDSDGVTAVILAQFDYNGDQSDFDMVGFYNKVAHFSDYWFNLDVWSTTEHDVQPDLAYNTLNSVFEATYFDATDSWLQYFNNDVNLADPNDWTWVSDQYNDATDGLNNPYPQISVNPMSGYCAFAWVQNNGSNDQAMFDQDGATVSVPAQEKTQTGLSLYPNPAAHDMNVSVSLKSASHVQVDVYNNMGQLMLTKDLGTLEKGVSNNLINIDGLANGNYFVKITGDRFVKTEQLVVAKN